MIAESNSILKKLWLWQASRKLEDSTSEQQYSSIYIIGLFGSYKHVERLLVFLEHPLQFLRNTTATSLKLIYNRSEDILEQAQFEKIIYDAYEKSSSLTHKLVLIGIIREFSLQKREEFLGPLLNETENDLQYAVIRSLADSMEFELLDAVLESAETTDLILRKTALKTWYEGIAQHDISSLIDYIGPRMHFMIRATYELQTDGNLLQQTLGDVNQQNLPPPKAYPDFIIRYFTELLSKWDYDPEAYQALHNVIVPSYFTFDKTDVMEDERPFIIL